MLYNIFSSYKYNSYQIWLQKEGKTSAG